MRGWGFFGRSNQKVPPVKPQPSHSGLSSAEWKRRAPLREGKDKHLMMIMLSRPRPKNVTGMQRAVMTMENWESHLEDKIKKLMEAYESGPGYLKEFADKEGLTNEYKIKTQEVRDLKRWGRRVRVEAQIFRHHYTSNFLRVPISAIDAAEDGETEADQVAKFVHLEIWNDANINGTPPKIWADNVEGWSLGVRD